MNAVGLAAIYPRKSPRTAGFRPAFVQPASIAWLKQRLPAGSRRSLVCPPD